MKTEDGGDGSKTGNTNDLTNHEKLGRGKEKVMAPHSSTFAWKITWMEEPGGLRSMGS